MDTNALLEARRIAPPYPTPRHADAVLLLAGMSSALPAFLAALDSTPWDRYSAEAGVFDMRVAVLALLQRRGEVLDGGPAPATLTS